MLSKLNPYRYIIFISIIGFFITGVLAYPWYNIWGDSNYAFTKFSIDKLPPTNWMGWFYVYFWDFLYNITGQMKSIGVFQNLVYWICMPVIFCNLFPRSDHKIRFKSSYNYWYLALVLNPVIVLFFMGITNNAFVASFLLISLALISHYLKSENKLSLTFALIITGISIFIRRDTLILALPILVYCSFFLTNKKWIFTILLSCAVLFTQRFIDKAVSQQYPLYSSLQESYQISIDTEALTIAYDLVAMSLYAEEFLVPDSVLKPEYQGENKKQLLDYILSQSPYEVIYNWELHQNLGYMYTSNTIWHSGLRLRDVFPIYLKNLHYYIYVKLVMFYGYSLYLWPMLFTSLIALIVLWNKNFSPLFSSKKRSFFTTGIISAWAFSAAVILSVNSIQARYLITSNILLWLSGLYIFYTVFQKYHFKFIEKQENK